MKSYISLCLLILGGSLLLVKCSCGIGHLCSNPIPEISFLNFDSSRLKAVIIKEYINDGKYDHLTDSKVYSNALLPGPDTLQLYENSLVADGFSDYMITVPAVNKTWYLKGISFHPVHNKQASQCTSGMSWYLNDTLHQLPANIAGSSLPASIDIYR